MRSAWILAVLAGAIAACSGGSGSSSSSNGSGTTTQGATSATTSHASSTGTPSTTGNTSATTTSGFGSTTSTTGTTGNTTANTTGTNATTSTSSTTDGTSGTTGVTLACATATDPLPAGPFTVSFTGSAGAPAGACSGSSVFRTSYTFHIDVAERLHLHVSNGATAVVTVPGCSSGPTTCGTDTFTDLTPGDYVVSFESPTGDPAPAVVRHELNPTVAIDCSSAVALTGVDTESHGNVLDGFSVPAPSTSCTDVDGGSYFDSAVSPLQGVWFSLHVDVASDFTAELRSDPYADLVLISGTSCSASPTMCAPSQGGGGIANDIFTQLATTLQPGDYMLAIVADPNSAFRGGSYALYTHLEPVAGNTPQPEPDPSLICVADGPVLPEGTFTVVFDGGLGVNPIGCGGDAGYRQVFRLPAAPNPLAVRITGDNDVAVDLREPGCLDEGYGSYCYTGIDTDAGIYVDNENEVSGPLAVVFSPTGAPAQLTTSFYELPTGNYDCGSAATLEQGTHEYQAYTGQPFAQPPATITDCQADGGGPHYPGASGAYFRIDVASSEHLHAELYTNDFADLVLSNANSCGSAPLQCAPGDSSCFFSCSYSTTFDTQLSPGSYYLQVVSDLPYGDHYGLFTTLGP